MIQNRIITETTITSSSTHIITIFVDNLVKRNRTSERMDFLALIPQPSGRIEHLSPDLLNLILQSTAPPPKDQPPEDEDDDTQWTPYAPHDATLVYNFLKGSRRLAKVYNENSVSFSPLDKVRCHLFISRNH